MTSGELTLQGTSIVVGAGTITGSVVNSATITPGTSPGAITITGDYTQTASGKLVIEGGGTAAGTGYDRLNVSGSVSLDGKLEIVRLANYLPPLSTDFHVLQGSSPTGNFNEVVGAAIGNSVKLQPSITANGVHLTAIADAGPKVLSATAMPPSILHWLGLMFRSTRQSARLL